ncbi:hypothetical protein [Comamonas endophytica]|uniref:Uncharacterized protein n=1 Tax=Comamonas endophytica TaxID=2949090 RepID=A0ABY6GGF9_9BURK|nr:MULTISPECIES: hypothetical protein [unclassified Acidovorax]MCD2514471.1 hypothetical protein [Acidovorax sp. D4N7]UYG53760.1 hypothetical protein M9799_17655 [Acidovorax sp. 5MLIR]
MSASDTTNSTDELQMRPKNAPHTATSTSSLASAPSRCMALNENIQKRKYLLPGAY